MWKPPCAASSPATPECAAVTISAFVPAEKWLATATQRGQDAIRMKAVVELLNEMKASGLVQDYALFGAMAQMRYTEPVATLDADVLVLLGSAAAVDALSPIYRFCRARGYRPEGEAILVGNWPVQFIPTFSALTEEAVREAERGEIEGIPARVVSALHLAVIALSVGRSKDFAHILALLEAAAVSRDEVAELAARHGLQAPWTAFTRRFLDAPA